MKVYINKCNEAMKEIQEGFIGLPHIHQSLINSLLIRTDPITGIVENITYSDIATLLRVDSAPGRKDSGVPEKQTIRSYLRTIRAQCGDHFQIISESNALKIKFPKLPAIYASFFECTEVYTDHDTVQHTESALINTEENTVLDVGLITDQYKEVYTDQYTPNPVVKKLFININNNTNNNNLGEAVESKKLKQPISPTFYPSQKTITRAIASGYSFATDDNVIQEFIDKNTAWGSEFADFNPVFLGFLAKHAHYQQQKLASKNIQGILRSNHNERTSSKINSYDAAMEQVKRDNSDALAPTEEQLFPAKQVIRFDSEYTAHLMALDGIDQDLRPIFYY